MKTKIYKRLGLAAILFLMVFSCQEPLENISEENQNSIFLDENYEFKDKLESLTKVFAKVFYDKDSQVELLNFSTLEGNDGEVRINLRTIFESNNTRSSSKIASRLNNLSNQNARTSSDNDWDFDDFDYDDFLMFINENDISIIAPYLAENFLENEIDNGLTISYYTEDMNLDKADLQDHTTPGYFIDYNLSSPTFQPVIVDDDYGFTNPTIVIGRLLDFEPDFNDQTSSTQNTTSTTPVVCENLTASNSLTLRMPEFQLNGNTRGWPNRNRMYLWVGVGDIDFDPVTNLPKAATNVNNIFSNKIVSRYNGRKQVWLNSDASFLIQNWKYHSEDMYISWGYFKRNNRFEVNFSTKVTLNKGTPQAEVTSSFKLTSEERVRQMNGISFDKCVLLDNNDRRINQNFGFRFNRPVYRFGGVSWYYTTTLL